ncbi:metallophosphoesterase [Haloimpatiens sp. FM7315]|uniref:metallophosphoesterase n=1 Tax=Haloimpatiens sp. FM7315 TaxID=3298609 RepID=UPI0035A36A68
MIIGVISDTHRNLYFISELQDIFKNCDKIIHLGDNLSDAEELKEYFKCPILNVRGNCDFTRTVPSERIEIIEGKKVFLTHGHEYDVKWHMNALTYKAREVGADIVLFGHTHSSMAECVDNVWYVNPGSPSLPRDGRKTVAIIEIKNGMVQVSIRGIK